MSVLHDLGASVPSFFTGKISTLSFSVSPNMFTMPVGTQPALDIYGAHMGLLIGLGGEVFIIKL